MNYRFYELVDSNQKSSRLEYSVDDANQAHNLNPRESYSSRILKATLVVLAIGLSTLLLPASTFRDSLCNGKNDESNTRIEQSSRTGGLFWNGTHWFNRTVIMISVDGMRCFPFFISLQNRFTMQSWLFGSWLDTQFVEDWPKWIEGKIYATNFPGLFRLSLRSSRGYLIALASQ